MKFCKICNNKESLKKSFFPYVRCSNCYHEYNTSSSFSSIINDILSVDEVKKISILEKFKRNVLKKTMQNNDLIIDLGSASGKFLFQNKHMFKNHLGIEVTNKCIIFSREKLGLNINTNLKGLKKKISVLTSWHSLEHIPLDDIEQLMENIRNNSNKYTRLIISVPNSNSLMYSLFKQNWAYFDQASHHHQFSKKSLDILLKKYDFYPIKEFNSFSYSIFGYLQSFLNKLNNIHNFMYYHKKRGNNFSLTKNKLRLLYFYNILLSVIFLIPSLILSLYDFISKEKRGVLTISYEYHKRIN